ncbi:MAG: mercury transporter MerT [Alphaproteobacteria bacterium]|nr:mercury transporter MerT [Alphaproteobacteria bacterium]
MLVQQPAARDVHRLGPRGGGVFALAGLGGALLLSTCCLLPLGLGALGLGGAWLGALPSFAAYETPILAGTLLLLAAGFFLAFRRPAACAPGAACGAPLSRWLTRLLLIKAAIVTFAAWTFPYVAAI